jgi:flagellar biosynthesis protein FlhB
MPGGAQRSTSRTRRSRALCATVEPDEEILPEHNKAVAKVIGYVIGLAGQKPQAEPGEK